MVGELTYFLKFQIKQLKDGIFISQSKYAKSIVKKFRLENARVKHTLAPNTLNYQDFDGSNIDESL